MTLKKDEHGRFINPGADHWANIVKVPDDYGHRDEPNPYDTKAKMEAEMVKHGASRDWAREKATKAAVAWDKNRK